MPPEEQDNRILLIIVAIMAAIGLFCLFAALGTGAWAHEARTVAGDPLNWMGRRSITASTFCSGLTAKPWP